MRDDPAEPFRDFDTATVVAKASDAAFGKPLVTNVLRGQIVEAIVALALEPEWNWCSADYASWDFDHASGWRLEVKQSSYRQTWAQPLTTKISPGFDVRPRKGRWEGADYIAEPGRAAHIYVFGYHDVRDETADHRDPRQWEFFVVPTLMLPTVDRIALGSVRKITEPVRIDALAQAVLQSAETLRA